MKQRRIRCKHFNGIIHDRCKAGIKYVPGHIDQCIGCGVDETAPCAKLEYPMPEEIARKEAETVAMMKNIATARKAIMADVGESGVGEIICPVCNCGTLAYTVAMNGHVHAKCSKSGCVCWME